MQINNINDNSVLRLKPFQVLLLEYATDTETTTISCKPIEIQGLEDYIITQARIQLGQNYEVTETNINWLFPQRKLRLYVDDSLVKVEKKAQSQLNGLIDYISATLNQYIIISNNYSIIYLDEILPEHKELIESYLIDNRLRLEQLIDGNVVKITTLY